MSIRALVAMRDSLREYEQRAKQRRAWSAVVLAMLSIVLLPLLLLTPKPAVKQESKFEAHCRECKQCRGDEPSEEGGPSPLCEVGFRLLQEDMKGKRK